MLQTFSSRTASTARTRRRFSLPLLLVFTFQFGCAARVRTQNGAPGRATTPIENALAYNASLADSNKSLADLLIAANKSGTLPQETVSNVTSVQFTIADADKQITAVLQAVADCQTKAGGAGKAAAKNCYANGAQMNTLIQRIQANANTLVASGDLGIKDASVKQSVETAINAITKSAGLILTTLQTAGILQ